MGRRLACSLVFAVACTGEQEAPDFTEDARIDFADASNDPDSFGTRMCATADGTSGTIYVLWMDNRNYPDQEKYDIWMNVSEDLGESWFPSAIKVNQGEGNVWNPDLYCNELGVFVVWEDDRDGELENHQIYFNRSTDKGRTFAPDDTLLEVDPDGFSMSLEPKITGYGQDLFVVWYDSLNGAYDILVNTSSNAGGEFGEPQRADSDLAGSAYSARPQIAVGENGADIWVVWEDSRDGAADIYFARSDNGGTLFKEDERLDEGDDDGANDSFEPQLCADPAGNLYAVWHDSRNGTGRDIYMNYSANKGDEWMGTALRLDTDTAGLGNSLFPVCVSDGSTLHVAWYDNRANGAGEGGYDIFYREVNGGTPGDEEVRLDVGEGQQAGFANSVDPRIAMDNGNVVVAWADGRGEAINGTAFGYDDLYYNYSEGGGPFDDEFDYRMDSMYDGQSFKVDLNLAVIGNIWLAAWTDGRNGTSDIFFQSEQIGEQTTPPTPEIQQPE